MAYITQEYYTNFGGNTIPTDKFPRIADIASDIIDSLVIRPIDEDNAEQYALVQKATAYQAEMLYEQGGIDSVVGFASSTGNSEHLGSYSVSSTTNGKAAIKTMNDIPVSTLALSLLRKAGLMTRWAYAGRGKRYAK